MSCQLPQHIYTSAGRASLGTVAVSPGVSREVLKQLEAQAQVYPNWRLWKDDPSGPPFVVRGFRLADGEFEYGVGLSLHVEDNFVSHSYIIPRPLLVEQDYNLPWIAACLPINFGYRPASRAGADEIPPLEFTLDPARQFAIFSLAARELGEAELRALLERLVAHAEAKTGQSLELEMPPPHPELKSIFHEALGAPPESAPPQPDALRLLRLAGALAILPAAFKQISTFTVNDLSPRASSVNSGSYLVRVARRRGSPPSAESAPWPWLDHCLELAASGQLDKLQELCAWLSKLMPGGCAPSRKALDVGFDFYRELVAAGDQSASSPRPADLRPLINRFAAFEGCDVNVDALYETFWPRLQHQETKYEDLCAVLTALSRIVAAARKPLPTQVFERIKECLQPMPGRKEEARQDFLRRLPEVVQMHIWGRSFLAGEPPGRVPLVGERPDPVHLRFALTTLNPDLLRDNLAGQEIIQHLAECLQRPTSLPADFYIGRRKEPLSSFLHGLWMLISLKEADHRLLQQLVTNLTELFFKSLPKYEYEEELWQVVNGALHHATSLGVQVLADFIRQVGAYDETAVFRLLLKLPLDLQRRRQTREFIHILDRFLTSISQRRFLRVLEELADILDRPERCDPGQQAESVLPRFVEWQKETKKRGSDDGTRNAFQEQLRSALQRLPAASRFNVGVTYLFLSDPRSGLLFEYLMAVLNKRGDKIAHWCVTDLRRSPERVRTLGRLLRIANEIGPKEVDRALVQVVGVAYAPDSMDQRCELLLQLDNYLAEAEIPRAVKQTMRDHLKRLDASGRE